MHIKPPLNQLLIPELQNLKQRVLRNFNTGNNIRTASGMAAESSNELSQYAQQIQAEIDSRRVNNQEL